MSDPKQLTDFPGISDEDTISLTIGIAGNANAVDFILETTPGVTWWKALELRTLGGYEVAQTQTQDFDHGPHTFSIFADNLVGTQLTLSKAKIFGIHTRMYELQNLSTLRGKSLHFLWNNDRSNDPLAGFLKDLAGGIKVVANAVADAVEVVIETVAEVVSTAIESFGNALADISYAVGDALAGIPQVGAMFRGIFHWLGSVASAVFSFAATLIKASFDSLANVLGGSIRMSGGLLAFDVPLVQRGFEESIGGLVGSFIAIFLKSIASVQASLFMQMGERGLTLAEQSMLTLVYRHSVNLDIVRVVDGFAGTFNVNPRPFTVGNTIYMKDTPTDSYASTLVHECCHVWQSQHIGTRYIADALWAQNGGGGYSWEGELARGHFRWQDFNKEAQARFLENVFIDGKQIPAILVQGEFYDDDPIGRNVTFAGPFLHNDETGLARESVAYVRSAGVLTGPA